MRILWLAFVLCFPVSALAQSCDLFRAPAATENLSAGAPTCSVSKSLGGGVSSDCHWRFPLRSDAAWQHYSQMVELLHDCADGVVTVSAQGVNHPDSYDQVIALVQGHEVSVSLKDKVGLGLTLVFLRRAAPTK